MAEPTPRALVVPQWTILDRLVKARNHAGLTQAELAARLGNGVATIKRYEKGVISPRRVVLIGWAFACGVDVDWLLTGNEPTDGGDGSSTIWYSGHRRLQLAAVA